MKLLLIGHSVEDHLNESGKEIVKPGGIFYTALGLISIKEKEDEIFLCTAVSKESESLFTFIYEKAENDFIKVKPVIPKVHLTIHPNKEREEMYENITSPLEVPENLSAFDGILINMITGFDISLDQLKKIRKNYNGLIYIDIHTLARGLNENLSGLQREFRIIPQFDEWNSTVDIIQANESELKMLYGKNELETAGIALNSGAKALIVTKGGTGSKIFTLQNGEIISSFISAIKINGINKIGCGDVFGGIFFYNYIKTKSLITALRTANTAGGLSAGYFNYDDYKNIKDDISRSN